MNMSIKLDRIDLNILAQVQKNGRIANVDLADAVGLSASPCLARLKKLEKAGYITGYSGLINLNKLGEFLIVYTEVTLTNHRANDFSHFEQKARKIEEVLECHLISGGYDYLLKFATRGVTQYQEIMEYMLEGDFGIEKYFSYIVIKSPFVKHHYPIKSLFGDND